MRHTIGSRTVSLLTLVLLIVLAGCTAQTKNLSTQTGTASYTASQTVIREGFETILNRYIEDLQPRQLLISGLSGLRQIDPEFQILEGERSLALRRSNQRAPYARIDLPRNVKAPAEDWSKALHEGVWEATRRSHKLSTASSEQIYNAVFDGITSNMDRYSRYHGAAIARHFRERRVGHDGITPQTVIYRRSGDIGYIAIGEFNAGTSKELKQAILALKDKSHTASPRGYILDLRGNSGGLLDQAVAVADAFLEAGNRIVSSHGRHPGSHQWYNATKGDLIDGASLTVLVDGHSASSAEIVAAALKDSRRAILIGATTYGKGSVQSVKELPNQGELLITWSRFYSPSGTMIHKIGVTPDICLDIAETDITHIREHVGAYPARLTRANCNRPEGFPSHIDRDVAAMMLQEPGLVKRLIQRDPGQQTAATLEIAR